MCECEYDPYEAVEAAERAEIAGQDEGQQQEREAVVDYIYDNAEIAQLRRCYYVHSVLAELAQAIKAGKHRV